MQSNIFMNFHNLKKLRDTNTTWKLLAQKNAPFIVSFLYSEFVANNNRGIIEEEIESDLESFIEELEYGMVNKEEINFFSEDGEENKKIKTTAKEYLLRWCDEDKGYLRRYILDNDIYYDLTPGAQKAIKAIMNLEEREFIGAESRFKTIIMLLYQIAVGSGENIETRISYLKEERDKINKEISDLEVGKILNLQPHQIIEYVYQILDSANDILGDLRSVEKNFVDLNLEFKEDAIEWKKGRGELLSNYFNGEHSIKDSNQGKSMKAFCDHLMSRESQNRFASLVKKVMENEVVRAVPESQRLYTIESDLKEAAKSILGVMARCDKDLRKCVENGDSENDYRRINQLINSIEYKFSKLKGVKELKNFTIELDSFYLDIDIPMARSLFTIPDKIEQKIYDLEVADNEIDYSSLSKQVLIDEHELVEKVKKCLEESKIGKVSLADVIERYPLKYGKIEFLKYLNLGKYFKKEINYEEIDIIDLKENGECAQLKKTYYSWKD